MGKGRFAMAIISIAMMVSLIGCSYGSHLVASAKYPESVAYDDYDILREIKENNPVSPAYLKGMEDFSANTAVEILRTQDQTKNTLYSPISLYFALALTASGAKNQTQEEILTLLHMKDSGIKQLERETGNLYRLLYRDNKVGKFHIANSLWMAHEVPFNQAFLDTATKNYYASLFSVDFSDKKTALTKVNFAKGTSVEPVENKVAMNLDRPFLYTITSENGVVLFMGIINNPFDINAT